MAPRFLPGYKIQFQPHDSMSDPFGKENDCFGLSQLFKNTLTRERERERGEGISQLSDAGIMAVIQNFFFPQKTRQALNFIVYGDWPMLLLTLILEISAPSIPHCICDERSHGPDCTWSGKCLWSWQEGTSLDPSPLEVYSTPLPHSTKSQRPGSSLPTPATITQHICGHQRFGPYYTWTGNCLGSQLESPTV